MINQTSFDCKQRFIDFKGKEVKICYLTSLCKDDLIAYTINGITQGYGETFKDCINNGDVQIQNNPEQQDYMLLSGCTLIFYENDCYILDTRRYPSRSIQEPETEKSVRGAKDGFNESILTNVGLLRRRIKTSDLVFQLQTVGKHNKLDISICYLDKIVNQEVLQKVCSRIQEVQVDDLVMSDRALEELILDQGYNPFPLVRYSERPDVVATHLLHGYIAIICDTSASVMMLPTTLFEILEHVEEHRQTPLIGTCIRILRFFAVILSLFLVPIWLLTFQNDPNLNTLIYQVLSMEISIELLRLATIHTPTSLSNAMGVIAAILLGQFAIDLGIFSEEVLLLCSIGNVCGFATPNYELSLTNKYIKILSIVCIALFKLPGYLIFYGILIVYMCSLKPLGCSYLYPVFPFDGKALLNFIIRKPKHKN